MKSRHLHGAIFGSRRAGINRKLSRFSEFMGYNVGRMTTTGVITEFQSPANFGLIEVIVGPDNKLWFTSLQVGGLIYRSTGGTDINAIPNYSTGSSARGITVGPDGNIWYVDQGLNKIIRAIPPSSLTPFSIPTASSGPQDIVTGPDGNLWFTELNANKIGRMGTDGTFTEFPIPAGVSAPEPTGIAAGPDGNLWFVEWNGNRVDRITPAGVITPFKVPTPNAFLEHIVPGPDGNLWFTEGGGNKIGRITP